MGLPPMPKIQPGCKMRALNWKKLENRKVKDSFWMDKKVVEEVEKVKFDEKKLEAMFEDASASRASMSAGEGSSSVEEKPKGPKTLLDMRRNQNISIVLGSTFAKIAMEDLPSLILSVNEAVLEERHVLALSKIMPTHEEVELCRSYDGDVSELGRTEQFVLAISSVPRYEMRVNCWIFKLKFFTVVEDLEQKLEKVLQAIAEIRRSTKFAELMKVILAVGNYVNGSTFRGGAYGFTVESLEAFRDMRGKDGYTFLMFVVEHLLETNPDVLKIQSELAHFPDASKTSTGTFKEEMAALEKGFRVLESQVEMPADGPEDRFPAVFGDFFRKHSGTFASMEKNWAKICEETTKIANYFGEDPTKFVLEGFFRSITAFMKDIENAQFELEKLKERKERAILDEEKRSSLASPGLASEAGPSTPSSSSRAGSSFQPVLPPGAEKGIMDSMVKELQDGSVFKNRRTKAFGGKQAKMDLSDISMRVGSP